MAKKKRPVEAVFAKNECPHDPETQIFYAGSWARKSREDRKALAHQVALGEMRRDPGDPHIYRRTLSHLLNGVTYPEAYSNKSYVRTAGDSQFRLINNLEA